MAGLGASLPYGIVLSRLSYCLLPGPDLQDIYEKATSQQGAAGSNDCSKNKVLRFFEPSWRTRPRYFHINARTQKSERKAEQGDKVLD